MSRRGALLRVSVVLALLAGAFSALPAGAVQPDDTLLFVGSTEAGPDRVTTIRADGTGVTTLAEEAGGWISGPAWSPDGSKVAFLDAQQDGTASLVMVTDTGGGRTVLAQGIAAHELAWSPDGAQVAAAGQGLWVYAVDGSGGSQLVPAHGTGVAGLDWSPDGARLVFAQDVGTSDDQFPRPREIRSIRPDGSDQQELTDGSHSDHDPKFSPDGQLVSFKRTQPNTRAVIDLMLMSPAGTDQRVISAAGDRGSDEAVLSYDWSPDGSRIVFSAMCDCIGHPWASVYVVQTDGSGSTVILPVDDAGRSHIYPVWSPDGQSVAVVRIEPHPEAGNMSESHGIFLMDADGSNIRAVYDNFDSHTELSFAPRVGQGDQEQVTTDVPASSDGQPVTATATMPAGVVSVTFSQVESGGSMTVVQRAPTSGEHGPGFTVLDTAFDITVSGVEFGSAEVCVPFDAAEAQEAGLTEEDLRLYHIGADGIRRDVTTSLDVEQGEVCGRVTEFSPFLVGVSRLDRLAGKTRVATAAAISAASFPAGVPVAYVATQADYPDALTGGPAAAEAGGPLLLVERDVIPAETAAELTRLNPLTVVVLGGDAVVSEAVRDQLSAFARAGGATRIAGADRYETAADISAKHFEAGVAVAYIATGEKFPDALAGGAAAAAEGAPVLLVHRDGIPGATAQELQRLSPGEIVVLGGTAVVSQQVEDQLGSYTDGEVTRLFGADRYGTAAAVLGRFESPVHTVWVATGDNFPDGMAAVPAAGLLGSPVALVRPGSVPEGVSDQLDRLAPDHLFVLGGHGAIEATVEPELVSSLR